MHDDVGHRIQKHLPPVPDRFPYEQAARATAPRSPCLTRDHRAGSGNFAKISGITRLMAASAFDCVFSVTRPTATPSQTI